MTELSERFSFVRDLLVEVAREFMGNRGLLLAGAVAFYMLFSSVPIIILLLLITSTFFDPAQLIAALEANLQNVFPAHTAAIVEEARSFTAQREVVGWVTLIVLVIFSGLAFGTLSQALGVVMGGRRKSTPHAVLLDALLPYVYIPVLGAAFGGWLLFGSALKALLESAAEWPQVHAWFVWLSGPFLYMCGTAVLLAFTVSLFVIVPARRPAWRHAFLGGVAAVILWELTRLVLLWYFTNLSLISVIYGSLATVIVVLLSFEAMAVILLLGAQLVATLERRALNAD